MAVPNIATLPEAPNRGDAPSDFSAKADTFVAALPPFVAQTNAVVAAINAYAPTIDGAAAAGAQASAAAVTATAAAAAAGAAINLAPYGNPGDSLQVNAARNGLVFGTNDGNVGDIRYGLKSPGSLWVPASAGIRSQISMPTLFAALGLLSPNVAQAWVTVAPSPAITGTTVDISSNQNSGVVIAVLAGTTGAAMRSTDYGATWTAVTIPQLSTLTPTCITSDMAGAWYIGTTNGIIISRDDGVTWVASTTAVGSVSRIAAAADGTVIATPTATNTAIWVSIATYFGSTFIPITTGATAVHACVAHDGKGTWIVGAGTQLRRSVDNGNSFSLLFTAAAAPTAIATDRQGNWMTSGATAASGTYKSPDNGLTWNLITMATAAVTDITYGTGMFVFVRSVSPQVGFLPTAGDSIVVTFPTTGVLASASRVTSSGKGIFNVADTANTNVLRSIPTYGYDYTTQFKLPDAPAPNGLQAWVKAGLALAYSFETFATKSTIPITIRAAFNDDNGTLMVIESGTGRRRAVSSDGGITWTTLAALPATGTLSSVIGNGSGVWLIGTSAGEIFRSSDNGLTFALTNSGFSSSSIDRIEFGLNNVVFAVAGSVAKKSLDGGATWIAVPQTLQDIATNKNGIWIGIVNVGAGTSVISRDNGVTYNSLSGIAGISSSTKLRMVESNTLVFVTDGGSSATSMGRFNIGSSGNVAVGASIALGSPQSALAINKSGYGAVGFSSGASLKITKDFGLTWNTIPDSTAYAAANISGGQNGPFTLFRILPNQLLVSASSAIV